MQVRLHSYSLLVSYLAWKPGYFVFPLDLNLIRMSLPSKMMRTGFSEPQYLTLSISTKSAVHPVERDRLKISNVSSIL